MGLHISAVLIYFATMAMLLVPLNAGQRREAALRDRHEPTPDGCEDDPSWSAYGRGEYTCAWLERFDPGCISNPCVEFTNFGQCQSCPRACRVCPTTPPSPPHEADNETSAFTPPPSPPMPVLSYMTEGLLTLAGILGFIAASAARRVGNNEGQIAMHNALMLMRLALALVIVHLVLGVTVMAHMLSAPDMCLVPYERLVPFSPATESMGKVVSFKYLHGTTMHAVLITSQGLNLLTRQCAPATLSIMLVGFTILFQLTVIRVMFDRTHEARRTQRVVEQ